MATLVSSVDVLVTTPLDQFVANVPPLVGAADDSSNTFTLDGNQLVPIETVTSGIPANTLKSTPSGEPTAPQLVKLRPMPPEYRLLTTTSPEKNTVAERADSTPNAAMQMLKIVFFMLSFLSELVPG